VAILVLASLALSLAACTSADDPNESNAAIISAMDILDKAGLHVIDDSLNKEGKVPADARTKALHLQTVVLLTKWPKEFSGQAKTLAKIFGDLAKSLDGDSQDVKKAGEDAKKAHDAAHDFSRDVWAHLQSEAGITSADATDDHGK